MKKLLTRLALYGIIYTVKQGKPWKTAKEDNMEINLTGNSYIYTKALHLANKELNKAIKLLRDNEDKWNSMLDLKLHDACCANVDFKHNGAMVTFDSDAQSDWFTDFCDCNYNWFIDDLKSNYSIDFDGLRDNVGRTSKFYLGKLHSNHIKDALAEASGTYAFDGIEIKEVNTELEVDIEESLTNYEDIEDFVNGLLDFADNIVDEVTESLDPILTVYDYITSFKESQVESFKEYVENTWLANA